MAVVHESYFWKNEKNDRDAVYNHRFVLWDKDWNIHKISPPWKFMNGKIEFCGGMARDGDDILITFGYQDNIAFLLRLPLTTVEEVIGGDQ